MRGQGFMMLGSQPFQVSPQGFQLSPLDTAERSFESMLGYDPNQFSQGLCEACQADGVCQRSANEGVEDMSQVDVGSLLGQISDFAEKMQSKAERTERRQVVKTMSVALENLTDLGLVIADMVREVYVDPESDEAL